MAISYSTLSIPNVQTEDVFDRWMRKKSNLQQLQRNDIVNNLLPQQYAVSNYLKTMQANKIAAWMKNPYRGQFMRGPAAEIQGLEMLKQQYGENSPQYQMGLKEFNLKSNLEQSRSNYLNANVDLKNLPVAERMRVLMQNNSVNPKNQAIQQAILDKYTSDQNTRQSAQNAEAMVNEVSNVPIEKIAKYAGAIGKGNAAIEWAKGQVGIPQSQDYMEYQNFAGSQVKLLTDQLRQVLQTSVVPGYINEMVAPILNQTYWKSNPKQAVYVFKKFQDWLKGYAKQKKFNVRYGLGTDNYKSPLSSPNGPAEISNPYDLSEKKQMASSNKYVHTLSRGAVKYGQLADGSWEQIQ